MTQSSRTAPRAAARAGVSKDRRETARARLRFCVACRKTSAPAELTRWVFSGEGGVLPDLAQGAYGRGAWLHPHAACMARAPAGFSRSFRAPVSTSSHELVELLRAAADRRVAALLGAARRSGKLAHGATAVDKELVSGRARLVVVAADAKSAARSSAVERAVREGRAVGWGTKASLGGLSGRIETGVLAVLDDGLASAVKGTIAMAQSAGMASAAEGRAGHASVGISEAKARSRSQSSTEVG